MYKNQLAHEERYSKGLTGGYDIETSYSVYEVYIEVSHDKDGNEMKNKDGSTRYFAIDDNKIKALEADIRVKQIREGLYKPVYEVNGDIVELNERDGKRAYFVVNPDKVITLTAGTMCIASGSGLIRIPTEKGYVLVDDKIIESPRILAVRKFETDNHEEEAKQIAKNGGRKPRKDQE